jgi:hypothetical protein
MPLDMATSNSASDSGERPNSREEAAFENLCLALRHNDPAVTKIDPFFFSRPPRFSLGAKPYKFLPHQ